MHVSREVSVYLTVVKSIILCCIEADYVKVNYYVLQGYIPVFQIILLH